MKNHTFMLSLLLSVPILNAEDGTAKPAFRDVATHEQILKTFQETGQQDPMKAFEKSVGDDPSKVNQPQNLLDASDIISFGGLTTLVPKHAIIQLPTGFSDRINNHQEGSRVVSWIDFYTLNRGWITTVEVSRVQAAGNEALAVEVTEQLKKNKNLVIATYSGGPISLQPLKGKPVEATVNAKESP